MSNQKIKGVIWQTQSWLKIATFHGETKLALSELRIGNMFTRYTKNIHK